MVSVTAQRVLGYFAVLVGVTLGSDAAQRPKNVKVTVVVILASDKHDKIDPRLVHVAKHVQKRKPFLTGFKLACMTSKSLPVNKNTAFELCEKQKVHITVKKPTDKEKCVVLAVKAPLQAAFEYKTVCTKYFPIVTRYETASGERLIIAIGCEPCSGGKK